MRWKQIAPLRCNRGGRRYKTCSHLVFGLFQCFDVVVTMPVSCAIIIAFNNTKSKGSIELTYLNDFGVASVRMLPDFLILLLTRGVAIFVTVAGGLATPEPGI